MNAIGIICKEDEFENDCVLVPSGIVASCALGSKYEIRVNCWLVFGFISSTYLIWTHLSLFQAFLSHTMLYYFACVYYYYYYYEKCKNLGDYILTMFCDIFCVEKIKLQLIFTNFSNLARSRSRWGWGGGGELLHLKQNDQNWAGKCSREIWTEFNDSVICKWPQDKLVRFHYVIIVNRYLIVFYLDQLIMNKKCFWMAVQWID